MKTNIHLWSHFAQFFLEWEMFQTKAVERIKTYLLCSVFSPPKILIFVMWKNTVEPDRPQITIWRTRIACWIPKATNTHTHTHRICNTYCFSTATVVAQMRLYVTLCAHRLSCLTTSNVSPFSNLVLMCCHQSDQTVTWLNRCWCMGIT